MMSHVRTRYPFTVSQWQELEHQLLIFKYMISGMPIPPHLFYTVRRSLDSSLSSSKLMMHHQPQQIGWSCFEMGFGRKIDPEPGRCRRTDGKKWRCSKEAYPDSKYCERHMHRGRNRSRKPVELSTTTNNTSTTTTAMSISSFCTRNSTPSSPTTSPPSSSHQSVATGQTFLGSEHSGYRGSSLQHSFLYPPHSSRNLGSDLSSQENSSSTTNFLLDSAPYSHIGKGYGNGMGRNEEVNELPFFSETSGTIKSLSGGTSVHDSWQLTPLTMRSSPLINNNMEQSSYTESGHSHFQLQSTDDNSREQKSHDYFSLDSDANAKNVMSVKFMDKDVPHKKVMHHFFDEWPKEDKDCWIDGNDNDNKLSRNGASSKIQLSISMPNSSHDLFFARNNEK